jgi:hypothetical protein
MGFKPRDYTDLHKLSFVERLIKESPKPTGKNLYAMNAMV